MSAVVLLHDATRDDNSAAEGIYVICSMRLQHVALTMIAVVSLAGCATGPLPARPANTKVALITSGDNYFTGATRFGPEISVVDIDGKPVDKPFGLIELAPGTYTVAMKCGDSIKSRAVTVAAGEVYQFAMVTTPGVRGCAGILSRVHPAVGAV